MADVPSLYQLLLVSNKQFRDATTESMFQQISESINWLSDNVLSDPVGTIKVSTYAEPALQAEMGTGWILCDGRSVVGSEYETITGNSNIPDFRGRYLRGANDGGSAAGTRADSLANPDDLSPGALQDSSIAPHGHVNSYAPDTVAVRTNAGNRKIFESTVQLWFIPDTIAAPNEQGTPSEGALISTPSKTFSTTNVRTGVVNPAVTDPLGGGSVGASEESHLCYLYNVFIRID